MVLMTESALDRARREAHDSCSHERNELPDGSVVTICSEHHAAIARLEAAARLAGERLRNSLCALLGRDVGEGDGGAAGTLTRILAECDADHEWRRQMKGYGYDSVAKVLDAVAAARLAGRLEQAERDRTIIATEPVNIYAALNKELERLRAEKEKE